MPVIPYHSTKPHVDSSVFIAPDAWVIGEVSLAARASVFFGSVLRGDILPISIGEGTNIQDHVVIHTSKGIQACIVGANATIGHRAILHGCEVRDSCIVGMGATILDSAVIGSESIVGAQALVPMNLIVPPRSLVVGVPARVVRQVTAQEIAEIHDTARRYCETASWYREYFSRTPHADGNASAS